MNYLRRLQLARMMRAEDGVGGGAAAAGDSGTGAPSTGDATADNDTGANALSLDDLLKDKSVKSQIDRYVQKALTTARTNWDADKQQQIDNARTEAERLAKMSADERAKAEAAKREKALQDRESELTRRELRVTAADALTEKGLPVGLAEILVYTDADACNASIEAVSKAFSAMLAEAMEKRVAGKDTPKGSGATQSEATALQERYAKALAAKDQVALVGIIREAQQKKINLNA